MASTSSDCYHCTVVIVVGTNPTSVVDFKLDALPSVHHLTLTLQAAKPDARQRNRVLLIAQTLLSGLADRGLFYDDFPI